MSVEGVHITNKEHKGIVANKILVKLRKKIEQKSGDDLLPFAMENCSVKSLNAVLDTYAQLYYFEDSVDVSEMRSKLIQTYQREDGTDFLMLAAMSGSVEKLNLVVSELNKADNRTSTRLSKARLKYNVRQENVICFALKSKSPAMLERVLLLFPHLHLHLFMPSVLKEAKFVGPEMQKIIWEECQRRGIESIYLKYMVASTNKKEQPAASEPEKGICMERAEDSITTQYQQFKDRLKQMEDELAFPTPLLDSPYLLPTPTSAYKSNFLEPIVPSNSTAAFEVGSRGLKMS